MKIGFIVLNNFKYDARVIKQSSLFAQKGHKVDVFALADEGLPKTQNINGVNVHRVNLLSRKLPKKIMFQVLKYAEYMVKLLKLRNYDFLFLSRAKSLPIGIVIRALSFNKVKLVYDTRELETESNGIKGFKKKTIKFIEKMLIPKVHHIFAVSESIKKIYEKNYDREVLLITNSVYYNDIEREKIFHEIYGLEPSVKIFLYQGRLTKGRGIELIIQAFKQIEIKDCVLVILGHGELKEWILDEIQGFSNIFLHDSVEPNQLLSYTSSADYAFCLIENTCLSYYYSLPNKLFEYSLAGLPVLASNLPELGKYVREFENGVIINEFTIVSIKNAIEEIKMKSYDEMSFNSKRLARENDWAKHEAELLKIIEG
ncbi:glycosyltransferase [Siminovitchia fordii]|uniref:Glycosyl transferase n=1 Tax=Siminovitchia fordii TaxID=254759 RepID=A0ABQ4KE54_9BACI|nr:glycosyltransferase [Siminovitchia fordii]GIN23158.1 glycosyl transferase [Siminovitchia fordii]